MAAEADYRDPSRTPSRQELESMAGVVLLEFGTPWCGICRALAPKLAALLEAHPDVKHVKVEDGPGRPLGRSFKVKLWPNLVFLREGVVWRQLARPGPDELQETFRELQADRGTTGRGGRP